MYPAFSRGDILFLNMSNDPITTGDITVFTLKGQAIPIVHRVIKVHEKYIKFLLWCVLIGIDSHKKEVKVLTKGDNNDVHDRGLYNRGQLWLEQPDFVGRVKLYSAKWYSHVSYDCVAVFRTLAWWPLSWMTIRSLKMFLLPPWPSLLLSHENNTIPHYDTCHIHIGCIQ